MWCVKQRLPDPEQKKLNGDLLPDQIRCLIVGPSGCGKTTLLVDNFILAPGWLNWHNRSLYVFSKTLDQSKYRHLRDLYDQTGIATLTPEVIPLSECKPNSVVVFDDYILENQNEVRNYFTRGRHKNLDCFYLAQTLSKVPKQLVRDNVNFLCVFRQDTANLKHIYTDYVQGDMRFDSFVDVANRCWSDSDYGFLTIDMTRKRDAGKYRSEIDRFIVPAK